MAEKRAQRKAVEKNLLELRAENKANRSRKGAVEHRLQMRLAERRAAAENQAREEESAAIDIQPSVEIPPADQETVQPEAQCPVATKARQRVSKHGAAASQKPEMENVATGAVKKAQQPNPSDASPELQNVATGAIKKVRKQPSNLDAAERQIEHFEATGSVVQPDEPEGGQAEDEDEVRLNAIYNKT